MKLLTERPLKRVFLLLSLFLLHSIINHAQTDPIEVGQLNDVLSEPSGIELIYNSENGQFEYWAHNDYDFPDSIFSFRLDDLSTMSRALDINQAYVDWEDMATDEENNIYLGDFGNWVTPSELQIVKIPNPDGFTGPAPSVEVIRYTYPFDGVSDMEAMFHHAGSLFLFTKSVNINVNPTLNVTKTYCFKIPDSPSPAGSYTAELVGSFTVELPGDADPSRVKVTAADISPDKKKMVLLCYERIWVFSCFEGSDFFGGTVEFFPIPYRQYEGACFINNHEIIITKEGASENPNYNPKIFYTNLFSKIDPSCLHCEKLTNGFFDQDNLAWTLFTQTGGTANASLDMSNGQAEINVTSLSTNQWHANLRHKSLVLENGKTYQIKFTAHADMPIPISIIANAADGSQGYFWKSQEITDTPTEYVHEFTMESNNDFNSYLSFNFGNSALTNIYIDDISLTEVDCALLTDTKEVKSSEYDSALVNIFPNPAIDQLRIEFQYWSTESEMSIFDSQGRCMGTYLDQSISLQGFPAGLYNIVILQNDKLVVTKRFVKLSAE